MHYQAENHRYGNDNMGETDLNTGVRSVDCKVDYAGQGI